MKAGTVTKVSYLSAADGVSVGTHAVLQPGMYYHFSKEGMSRFSVDRPVCILVTNIENDGMYTVYTLKALSIDEVPKEYHAEIAMHVMGGRCQSSTT